MERRLRTEKHAQLHLASILRMVLTSSRSERISPSFLIIVSATCSCNPTRSLPPSCTSSPIQGVATRHPWLTYHRSYGCHRPPSFGLPSPARLARNPPVVKNMCRKDRRPLANAPAVPAKSNLEARRECAYSPQGGSGHDAPLSIYTLAPITMRRCVSFRRGWRAVMSVACGEKRCGAMSEYNQSNNSESEP